MTDRSEGDREKKAGSVEEIYRKPGKSDRVQALLDFYSNLGPDDFASEAERLENLPFNERILASVILFGKWAEVDPRAAMGFTDTMGFAGVFVRPTVLQGWASNDPVNAAKYYTENSAQFAMMNMMGGGGGGRRGGMGAQGPGEIIAGEWAKQDPDAALAWATGLKTNSGQALTAVISEVAKSDPKKAAVMAAGMSEESQGGAYGTIAREWGTRNFAEAEAWANGLPAAQRSAALASAIEGLAQSSPELAAAKIDQIKDVEALRNAVPSVAKNYAREDPRGSMEWLDGIDNDGAKQDSMREVMPIWAAKDSGAALEFIRKQSSPAVKDSAAEAYVWSSRTSPPAEMVEVAGMIADEGTRGRTTGIVAARWMQEDKPAATEFINGSSVIPADMKQRLLEGKGIWGGGRR
ncbi:MAG: hypothetical protein H7Y36_07125 [Armatimonadetes bacterium]|nr:hypothetical protein [Akkermansiaceae bacterium]